jgi:two-component system osmolarity sensor histidine kinase EnvZ
MIKKFLPRSLLGRSLLILVLPVFLILTISTYVFFERHWERMSSRLAVAVAGEVALIVDWYKNTPSEEAQELLTRKTLQHLQLSTQFFEGAVLSDNSAIYQWRGDIIKRLVDAELSRVLTEPYKILVDTQEKWIQIQVQLPTGVLMITSPERRLFSSSGFVFLIYMVGVSTLLMVIAILFMRNQIRPIKRLAIAADRFGKGRDVPFFKIEGAREVRQAARAFLGMRDRLSRQIEQRTAMLAGVSHDLRTPLTRIKLQASMLEESNDKEALMSDIADMERMMNAYLQFARGEGQEEMERIDIVALLDRLKENFEREGINIRIDTDLEELFLFLKPVAMERALANIFSNAQKYASFLTVSLLQNEENLKLIFDDDGSGIKPENYEEVFKPFYREETSRNQKTGGTGLGLPITKDIILAHGGDIQLDQSPKGGLRVIVELPL